MTPQPFLEKYTKSLGVFCISSGNWRFFQNFVKEWLLKILSFWNLKNMNVEFLYLEFLNIRVKWTLMFWMFTELLYLNFSYLRIHSTQNRLPFPRVYIMYFIKKIRRYIYICCDEKFKKKPKVFQSPQICIKVFPLQKLIIFDKIVKESYQILSTLQ